MKKGKRTQKHIDNGAKKNVDKNVIPAKAGTKPNKSLLLLETTPDSRLHENDSNTTKIPIRTYQSNH